VRGCHGLGLGGIKATADSTIIFWVERKGFGGQLYPLSPSYRIEVILLSSGVVSDQAYEWKE